MFDVGFWELALVAVVALLVVGPERLPTLARTAGLWLGRGRRMISSVKADIERELKAEELKKVLADQAKNNPLEEIISDTRESFKEIRRDAENALTESKKSIDSGKGTVARRGDDGD